MANAFGAAQAFNKINREKAGAQPDQMSDDDVVSPALGGRGCSTNS